MKSQKVLVGVTGGVAAYKACLLVRRLKEQGHEVKVILTRSAERFVGIPTFHALTGNRVYNDIWDPSASQGGEPHIELSAWADVAIVYPATADFVARLAGGRSDDLLAATLLALEKPLLVCPAMHTRMVRNFFFGEAVNRLRQGGVAVLEPEVGALASGEVGEGRLPEPEVALEALWSRLTAQDLDGYHLLVSAGPTREHLDPVRYLSNPSTGRMGFALARMAARRGARVTLVTGPTSLPLPHGVEGVRVQTATQMGAALGQIFPRSDALLMSAAVADFAPRESASHKVKKTGGPMTLELLPTQDILKALAAVKGQRVVVGFAMETEDLLARAADKRRAKNLDIIVANDLTAEGAGFEVKTNRVTLLEEGGTITEFPLLSKDEVASRILDRVAALLRLRAPAFSSSSQESP